MLDYIAIHEAVEAARQNRRISIAELATCAYSSEGSSPSDIAFPVSPLVLFSLALPLMEGGQCRRQCGHNRQADQRHDVVGVTRLGELRRRRSRSARLHQVDALSLVLYVHALGDLCAAKGKALEGRRAVPRERGAVEGERSLYRAVRLFRRERHDRGERQAVLLHGLGRGLVDEGAGGHVLAARLEALVAHLVDGGHAAVGCGLVVTVGGDGAEEPRPCPLPQPGVQAATPSHAQAIKLKRYSREGSLAPALIRSIMEEKPNQIERVGIPRKSIARFFAPGATEAEIEGRIVRALEPLEQAEARRVRQGDA